MTDSMAGRMNESWAWSILCLEVRTCSVNAPKKTKGQRCQLEGSPTQEI